MSAEVQLSVSNICWPDGEAAHREAIDTLVELDVPAIDIAPTKVWPKIVSHGTEAITRDDVAAFRQTLHGRAIAGLQSLTYGVEGSIFGNKEGFDQLTRRVKGTVDIARLVGATTVIYGGPKTREVPTDMTVAAVEDRALTFFGELAEYADSRGVVMGIEPVSTMYTPHPFGRSSVEVASFCAMFREPGGFFPPALVPDTFAMHDSGEHSLTGPRHAADNDRLAPHWQISERSMDPVGHETDIHHELFDDSLYYIQSRGRSTVGLRDPDTGAAGRYHGPTTVAIEMRPDAEVSVADGLRRAVGFVRDKYRTVQ